MAKPRKTIELAELVKRANVMLGESPDGYVAQRQAIFVLVSGVLLDARAYNGFEYLNPYRPEDPTWDGTRIAFYSPL